MSWIRVIIGSHNGSSNACRQAITYTKSDILSTGPWETNFSEISIKIWYSLKKMLMTIIFSEKISSFFLKLWCVQIKDSWELSHLNKQDDDYCVMNVLTYSLWYFVISHALTITQWQWIFQYFFLSFSFHEYFWHKWQIFTTDTIDN